jgi:NAD(P)-dependent dehydrogenase (short-subunit alcohol dehydrogenase family)
MKLRGKVVWITGASSGIGEALAHAYARKGANVVLGARRRDELERVAHALPPKSRWLVLPADVADFEAIPEQLATIERTFGPVDVLVNNAGVSQRSLVVDTTLETYRRLMEIDFFATVALTKAVLPSMRGRESRNATSLRLQRREVCIARILRLPASRGSARQYQRDARRARLRADRRIEKCPHR